MPSSVMIEVPQNSSAPGLRLAYSMADQDFERTKSVGILNLSTHLLRALARHPGMEQLHFFGNSTLNPPGFEPDPPRRIRTDFTVRGHLGRMVWDQFQLYANARKSSQDWLFLPKGFASFLRRPPARLCAYVHDIIIEMYRTRYPGVMSRMEIRYFLMCLRATLKEADLIFTNSEFTRRELLSFADRAGIQPSSIQVAGIGFEPPCLPAGETAVPRESLMVLASPMPHKLTRQAVAFLDRWQNASNFRAPVVFVGRLPEDVKLPGHANWRHHPRLPEPEYRQLLHVSRLLLYFSEYEGFGMPPVEAVLAGVCPVYSDIPAVREVIEDAGFAFDNTSEASFQQAMDQALATRAHPIEQWKSRLLARHNWDLVANRMVEGLSGCSRET